MADTLQAPFSLLSRITNRRQLKTDDFYAYYEILEQTMDSLLEKRDKDYFNLSRKALSGSMEAVPYFINEIEKYLIRNPFTGKLPPYYRNNAEGLFQEWKGFSSLYEWFTNRKYAESSGLQIIGTNVFYRQKGRYEEYPYNLPSIKRAQKLRRQLLSNDPTLHVDESKPEAELNMIDPLWPDRFLRIAIWMPKRVWEGFDTITIRRQIVEYLNLEEQVGTNSIPAESIPIFESLCDTNVRMVVAGPVDSGKSTFANTLVGTRLQNAKERIGVIMIEKHPESLIPLIFKGHRIIPVRASDSQLMNVGIESLRMDPQIIYLTEMRYNEWEFYLYAGEKGHEGLIGTYHTEDAEDIPYQGANAVYALRGGSLRGHLISALKACEFVVIMKPHPSGEKRVVRVSEIQYDEHKHLIYANDIMRYDQDTDSWSYNDQISDQMRIKMMERNPRSAKIVLDTLSRLAAERRIVNPIVESLKSKMVLYQ